MDSFLRNNKKAISLLTVLLLIVAGIAGGLGYFTNQDQERSAQHQENASNSPADTSEYELVVSPGSQTVGTEENLDITVTMYNRTDQPLEVTFPNSCTQPDVFVNGEYAAGSRGQVCAQMITDITIPPHGSNEWEMTIPAQAFDEQTSRITAEWDEYDSEPVEVEVTE